MLVLGVELLVHCVCRRLALTMLGALGAWDAWSVFCIVYIGCVEGWAHSMQHWGGVRHMFLYVLNFGLLTCHTCKVYGC